MLVLSDISLAAKSTVCYQSVDKSEQETSSSRGDKTSNIQRVADLLPHVGLKLELDGHRRNKCLQDVETFSSQSPRKGTL